MAENIQVRKGEPTYEAEQSRNVPTFVPATDIYETQGEIVVLADMPGVDEKSVDVRLEDEVLSLSAHAADEKVEGMNLVAQTYAAGDYHRSFMISEDVDRDSIRAQLKDGVLRITMAKAKAKQPRKIEVQAG